MDDSLNFLYGVVALQANLINSEHFNEFMEACNNLPPQSDVPLADIFVARGWIQPDDKAHLVELVERKLQKQAGNVTATLTAIRGGLERTLTVLNTSVSQKPARRPADPELASRLEALVNADRYTRTQLHATGGIGRVWVARDSQLGRDVALKELLTEQSGNSVACARFLREARITGQLEHPRIVPVYELSQRPGTQEPFYIMRFVKGHTLKEVALAYHAKRNEGQPDSLEFLGLLNAFVAVCKTVAYAHSRGVIHRDLKGQNIMVGDYGEVVVLDWGLAKVMTERDIDDEMPSGSAAGRQLQGTDLTLDGEVMGTPSHMAPEQAAGRLDLIDERTDVYGLGAMLYQILTGQPPFAGTTEEILKKVQAEQPLPPEKHWPDVPPILQAACLRALAKQPEARFASAHEFAQEVEQWQEVQRKKAEEALRVSEALYHSLVENIPLCVWRKDRDGRFTFANVAFSEVFGIKPEDMIGKSDEDFFPPALVKQIRRDDGHVLKTGQTLRATEEQQTPQGARSVELIKTPIRDSRGEIIGTQGIFWDITA